MGRLTTFINEKVSKKEIDDALESKDVRIGAEFEFKIDNDRFQDIWSNRLKIKEDSEKYDEEVEEWQREMSDWKRAKEDYFDEARSIAHNELREEQGDIDNDDDAADFEEKVQERSDELISTWLEDNPEPEKPQEPYDYISDLRRRYDYDEDDLADFSDREDFLIRYMENDSQLKKYTGSGWEIHDDSSLERGNGIELVSPPMPLKDFLIMMPLIFDMINKIGYTDEECGLHIGVSLTHGMSKVDTIKLILFTDEGYIWNLFEERKSNQYVEHMQRKIREALYSGDKYSYRRNSDAPTVERVLKLKEMIMKNKVKAYLTQDHYHGVNTEHLDSDDPYIEFRYIGYTGYQQRWKDIQAIIAIYIYNLKLSRDPEFKKKEYILKCNRILLKLEAWAVMKELKRLKKTKDEWTNDDDDIWKNVDNEDDGIEKKKIAIKTLERKLTFLPKLSDREIRSLQRADS